MPLAILPPIAVPFSEDRAGEFSLSLFFFSSSLSVVVKQVQSGEVLLEHSIAYPSPFSEGSADSVAATIYGYPFLTYPFQQVFVHFLAKASVAVPTLLLKKKRKHFWLATTATSDSDEYVGAFTSKRFTAPTIVASWYKESFNFLRRTYGEDAISPISIALMEWGIEQSLRCHNRLVLVFIEAERIEMMVCFRGELLFSNQFAMLSATDLSNEETCVQQILFYWTSIVKSFAFESVVGDQVLLWQATDSQDSEAQQRATDQLNKQLAKMGVRFEQKPLTCL